MNVLTAEKAIIEICRRLHARNLLAAADRSGPLVVARRLLWVKPVDQTVKLRQPNPTGCTLELTNGSTFVHGDSWASVSTTYLRCTNSRN